MTVKTFGLEITDVNPDLFGDGQEVAFALVEFDDVDCFITKENGKFRVRAVNMVGDMLFTGVADTLDGIGVALIEESTNFYRKDDITYRHQKVIKKSRALCPAHLAYRRTI